MMDFAGPKKFNKKSHGSKYCEWQKFKLYDAIIALSPSNYLQLSDYFSIALHATTKIAINHIFSRQRNKKSVAKSLNSFKL